MDTDEEEGKQVTNRDTAAQFGLAEIMDPRAVFYATRADYEQKTGKPAPAYNPGMGNKYWAWVDPIATKNVSYLAAEIENGKPVVVPMTVSASYARTVNIPAGEANAEEEYSTEYVSLPIQPLRADEYLALGFAGLIVVRNRTRFAEPVSGFEQRAMDLLQKIAAKVGVALLLVLACALAVQAQTQVKDAQVAAAPTAFTAIQVTTPQGKVFVQPEPTIQIDLLATPPVIRAVCPAPPAAMEEAVDRFLVPEAGQTVFTLSAVPAVGKLVKVYRNGVFLWPDIDYSISGQTVAVLPLQGTAPVDRVQILYWR